MLILSKNGNPVSQFKNYRELYRYITSQENAKLLKGPSGFEQSWWSFLFLSPARIAELIHTLRKEYDEKILMEAQQQQLAIVEICEGNYKDIRQILVTPNINVEALREDWCVDYCDAHGMTVIKDDEYFDEDDLD